MEGVGGGGGDGDRFLESVTYFFPRVGAGRYRVGLRACPMSLYRGDFESNVGRVVEAAEFFVIFVWVPACGGHFLATESRWILQRRAGNSLLALGGFLRNLWFRGVGVFSCHSP